MEDQLVQDCMTRDPITITSDTPVPEAHELMTKNAIRHLPVVDDGKLVGIVTLGDLRGAEPSDAAPLDDFELAYLLERTSVKRYMTPDPITITPTTTIARAAQIMLTRKIGGLPVVESGKLVGIITDSDVFQLLAGYGAKLPEVT
jgi:CBS domain-containing protein